MTTSRTHTRLWRWLFVVGTIIGLGWSGQRPTPVAARVGGPDGGGYVFTDNTETGGPVFVWNEIVGAGGVRVPTTDSSVANVQLPFPVTFYGVTSTVLRVGNNGAIRFNDATTTSSIFDSNYPMTDASNTPDYFIAPWWDDLGSPNDPAGVYTATLGVAPNRTFIVEWKDQPRFGVNNSTLSFQVVFSEGSTELLFYYNDVDAASALYNNGLEATIGIRGAGSTRALQYSYNEAALANGRAIRFSRVPAQVAISPTSAQRRAAPSRSVSYPLTVTNLTGVTDSFAVTYGTNAFPFTGPNSVGPLGDSAQQVITVTVTIPANTPFGTSDVLPVTLTAQGNPSYTRTVTLETIAFNSVACPAGTRTIPTSNATGITLPLTVTNGLIVGALDLDLNIATTTPAQLVVNLINPQGIVVRLHNQTATSVVGNYPLTLPVDGPGSLANFVGERGDGVWQLRIINPTGFTAATLQSCQLNITRAAPGIYLAPAVQSSNVAPGATATYNLTLANTTNQTQNVVLSYSGSQLNASGPSTATVPANGSTTLTVQVATEPSTPPLQADVLTVSASVAGDPTLNDTATLRTLVRPTTWERRASLQTKREAPAAVGLNGLVYVLGGRAYTPSAVDLATVEVYNPTADSWTNLGATMPGAKRSIRAVALGGKIYVPGGETGAVFTASNYAFDPNTSTWSTLTPLPTALAYSVLAADPVTNKIYSFGGRTGSLTAIATTYIFDPQTNAWITGAPIPLPSGRTGLGRTVGAQVGRKVYVTGGIFDGSGNNTVLYIYDIDTNSWTTGAGLPEFRFSGGAAELAGNFCVVGGTSSSFSKLATAWCYQRSLDSWFQLPNLNVARDLLASATLNGLYAIGGLATSSTSDPTTCTTSGTIVCGTVERYGIAPARFAGSTKDVTPSSVEVGGIVTYTLRILNNGQLPGTAKLTDTLSSNLVLLSQSAGLAVNGAQLTASTVLAPGASQVYTFTAQVQSGGESTLTNSYVLSGDGSLRTITAPVVVITGGATATATTEPSVTASPTSSATAQPSATPTATDSPTLTPSSTATSTATNSPTLTPSNTATPTPINSPTLTPSSTATSTATNSPTLTPSNTATSTATNSPTLTPSTTATTEPSATRTSTPTTEPSATATNTITAEPSATSTTAPSATSTSTATTAPSATSTSTATTAPSATSTSSATMAPSATQTATPQYRIYLPLMQR